MLSAFSLMHSTEWTMQQPAWVGKYLIKRFWRIAPLFYFMIACELCRRVVSSDIMPSVQTILLNITFGFGLVPPSTTIVSASWSVGVEMLFYALLPVLMLSVRRTTVVLLVLSVVARVAIRVELTELYRAMTAHTRWNWGYFAFESNFCFFVMGLLAYRLQHTMARDSVLARWVFPTVALSLFGFLMLTALDQPLKRAGRVDLLLWVVGFSALAVWQCQRPSRGIANWFFEHVGERSYSVYLLHPVVIPFLRTPLQQLNGWLASYLGPYAFFVSAVLVIGVLLLASEITYRFIEVPGIRFGRRITSAVTGRAQVTAVR